MPTPDTGSGPGFDTPLAPGGQSVPPSPGVPTVPQNTTPTTNGSLVTGNAQYDALIADATNQINQYSSQMTTLAQQVAQASQQIAGLDTADPGYAAAVRNYDSLNASYVTAMNNLSRAYDNRVSIATKALDARWMQPGQEQLWRAQAANDDAAAQKTIAETSALQASSGATRDEIVARSAAEQAQARLTDAQTGVLGQKTPAEIQQLQASSDLATANAAQARQATAAANAKLPAEVKAGQASADALVTAAQDAVRKLRQAPTDAQAAATNQATVDQQQTAAAQAAQNLQKGQTGTLAFLPQQLDAIRAGVAAIGDAARAGKIPSDPESLDQLLNHYITSTVGGTTIANASQQTQNALQNTVGNQITQRAQDIGLTGQKLNAFQGAATSAFGTLADMNKYAPKGSTAMSGAFNAMLDMIGNRLNGPQFAPPPQVAPPPLPPFLAAFAAPGSPGMPPTMPRPPAMASAGGQQPSVNINIGGGQPVAPAPPPMPTVPQFSPPPTNPLGGTNWLFNSPASPIANLSNLPNFLGGAA